jgi:hypothetical protein
LQPGTTNPQVSLHVVEVRNLSDVFNIPAPVNVISK